MKTAEHQQHIATRTAHNNCSECRGDTERSFVPTQQWRYQHVAEYLNWAKPRLAAIATGEDSTDARIWLRKFRAALHARINLKTASAIPQRKRCNSYLERMGQFPRSTDAAYLRRFAQRGASALDS